MADDLPRVPRRRLGRSGIETSRLGLAGSYGIDAEGAARAFHELGGSYFFVTHRMKPLVRAVRQLRDRRDELVIASGAFLPFGWSVWRAWEKQARALGVDCIDVFHLFWVQAHWYVDGDSWDQMRRLKEEGKVRALAISCHDRPLASGLADELGLDVLMIRYNAAHRGAEHEIFDELDEADRPGIVSYTATRWGKLLEPVGGREPMSAPECYRFALTHPMVDVVLTGAESFEQLVDNARGVCAGPLTDPRLSEVKQFGDAVRATVRGRIGFG